MQQVKINSTLTISDPKRLLLIAGPCQIESYDHCEKIAKHLVAITRGLPIDLVFKASYDKANRTSLEGKRGVGMKLGLEILSEIKSKLNLPVLTDVHLPDQVEQVSSVVDILQIPAFLCRQTDLLLAVGKTGRAVNIKKGQFLAPQDIRFCLEKVTSTGNKNVLLCERGTCFGYRDLVVDMRSLLIMQEFGYPVIFDATHSVQSMGGESGKSGGSREFIPGLACAAITTGINGLFLECHDDPDNAPSDAASMLPLSNMEQLLNKICKIKSVL